jgi:hypothetical protein
MRTVVHKDPMCAQVGSGRTEHPGNMYEEACMAYHHILFTERWGHEGVSLHSHGQQGTTTPGEHPMQNLGSKHASEDEELR